MSTYPSSEQDEIDAFAAKLSKWSETLPEGQRSLAHVLVEHARELTPRTVALAKITADLRTSVKAVIDAINIHVTAPQGWARVDPVWEKRNQLPLGEDVEIVQRVFFNTKR